LAAHPIDLICRDFRKKGTVEIAGSHFYFWFAGSMTSKSPAATEVSDIGGTSSNGASTL
jgi:hypothetical protein